MLRYFERTATLHAQRFDGVVKSVREQLVRGGTDVIHLTDCVNKAIRDWVELNCVADRTEGLLDVATKIDEVRAKEMRNGR
jgi:hypothetical protein